MKIHLIPDETLDGNLYARVLGLLQAIPGVNKFYPTDMGRLMLPEEMYEDQQDQAGVHGCDRAFVVGSLYHPGG